MSGNQIEEAQDVKKQVLQIICDVTGESLEESQLGELFLDCGIACGASARIEDQLNRIYPKSQIEITCWENSPQDIINQICKVKKVKKS